MIVECLVTVECFSELIRKKAKCTKITFIMVFTDIDTEAKYTLVAIIFSYVYIHLHQEEQQDGLGPRKDADPCVGLV